MAIPVQEAVAAEIRLPYPIESEKQLTLSVGACRLHLRPGSAEWVSGTYNDPSGSLPCQVIREGGRGRVTQDLHLPPHWGQLDRPPRFDLALGTAEPYALTLEVGACDAEIDLGGLPLTRMSGKIGAGKCLIDFSAPNLQPMTLFDLAAGAASLEVHNLANTNAGEIVLQGGAAAYVFDFRGTLRRDMHVRISTGLSSLRLAIPATLAATVACEHFLGSVDASAGFTRRDGVFWTTAALNGSTPLLQISAHLTIGSVQLRLI